MKYLKRYNESAKTDTVDIIKDILADLKDMGAEGRTELYWVPKDYKPGEAFQTNSRVEFGGAIRLYWTEFEIPVRDDDFEFTIEIMKEMVEVRSKLKSLSDDVYFRWKTFTSEDNDSDRYGKKYLHFTIKLKKHDEVSTKDPQDALVKLIKPFCDKNGYTVSASKKYPENVHIKLPQTPQGRHGKEYDKFREERYKLAEDIINIIHKLVDGKVQIEDWEPNQHFYNLDTIQIKLSDEIS